MIVTFTLKHSNVAATTMTLELGLHRANALGQTRLAG
jgi:hypothetical protein